MSKNPTPINTKTYHVFLASPSDMEEERQMVRDFFSNYNRNTANQRNLQFKLIDWENYSDVGLGQPQNLINAQTLDLFEESLVLFIGLLGQRFGTATGDYQSGTEEEFNIALAYRQAHGDYPEIKWFFREKWSNAELSTDPDKLQQAAEQLQKVKAFKDALWKEGKQQAYTKPFPTSADFSRIFDHDLRRWLENPDRDWNQSLDNHSTENPAAESTVLGTSATATPTPYFAVWQRKLTAACARLPLEVLDPRQGLEHSAAPIQLPDIFVPLNAVAPSKKWLDAEQPNEQLVQEITSQQGESAAEPKPVMELLEHQRLAVLLGDPGSGKSVLLNQLCWQLIQQAAEPPDYLIGCVPVRIILRRVNIPATAKVGKTVWIWDALQAEIAEQLDSDQQHAPAVLANLKQGLLEQGNGLLLLDGLDEVSHAVSSSNQHSHRQLLIEAINQLVIELPDTTRFIVSARPYAYTDPSWRLPDFTSLVLTSFDKEQRKQFIRAWYATAKQRFSLETATLKKRIPALLQQVETKSHLRELAKRPLLLTLIATLHASGKRMPEDRAALYEDSVNLLLYQWRNAKHISNTQQHQHIDETLLRGCLQQLAYNAHHEQGLQSKHSDDAAAGINEKQLLTAFKPLLKTMGSEQLLSYLQQHSGILIARDNNRFAFPHRSFQEYLAMAWLAGQAGDSFSQTVSANPLWWREVFLLALLKERTTPNFAMSYIQQLQANSMNLTKDKQQQAFVLAGLGMVELGSAVWNNSAFLQSCNAIRRGIVNLLKNPASLNVTERAEAGRVLGEIGDSRPGTGLSADGIPDIVWQPIPAGEITLEANAGRFAVEQFHMARYPVTNAQFQAFIDDPDGYQNAQWWVGLDQQADKPKSSLWSNANHPKERVSWFEAMAYCAWLSSGLNLDIRLPTEWQWQQAACSANPDFAYPWGKKYQTAYANINETVGGAGIHYLQRTTAVGIYPQGDSSQGVADLTGNVLEWCLNTFETPGNRLAGTGVHCVQGGSWLDSSEFVGASSRQVSHPGTCGDTIGFRLCCFSPI